MADADFDGFDMHGSYRRDHRAEPRLARQAKGWVNSAGALTSVALIAGLAWWAYDLAVRDVRGVPVIQALEGPARVAPDNPGGELALHQGMAVNRIAADGTAAEPPDSLTLAPKPDGLAEADQPMTGPVSGSVAGLATAPVAGASDFLNAPAAPAPETPLLAGMRPVEPLPDGPADPIDPDGLAAAPYVAPDVIPASVPGIAQSLRPQVRPGARTDGAAAAASADDATFDAMAEAAAAAVSEALSAPQTVELAPEALPAGTRLVQIGAYPTEADARLAWDQTAARFGGLMDGKRRVIEPSASGGEAFYRLRVEGFTDLEDARRFCSAFKAENAECVPAAVR